jgi:hypothetical protein
MDIFLDYYHPYAGLCNQLYLITKDNNITIQIKSNNLLDGIIYNASVQFTPFVANPTTWPSEFRKQLILANRPKKNKVHTQFLFQNSANVSC